jgi:sugar/nucleoside kinase (ribokinase family)
MNRKKAIDYLLVGHTSCDVDALTHRLGGTVAYAGLTAHRLGRTVGAITSTDPEEDLSPLSELNLQNEPAEQGTTFQNVYLSDRRNQRLLSRGRDLDFDMIPGIWRQAEIVHLAPIAAEVDLDLFKHFPHAFLVATPQGWLRGWDQQGYIKPIEWMILSEYLEFPDALVLSDEDLGFDRHAEQALAKECRVLGVTCGEEGARIYTGADMQHIPAPDVEARDPTGAGDIFAAVFFIALQRSGDPFKAAQQANHVAAQSVTRTGLEGIPSSTELSVLMDKV